MVERRDNVPYSDSEAVEAWQWVNRHGPSNAWTATGGTAARMIGRLLRERERLQRELELAKGGSSMNRRLWAWLAAAFVAGCGVVGCVEAFGGDLVFLAFTRPGCPPCARLHEDFGSRSSFRFVDVSKEKETAEGYGVRSTPTIVAVNGKGEEIDRRVGYDGKRSLTRWVERIESGKK